MSVRTAAWGTEGLARIATVHAFRRQREQVGKPIVVEVGNNDLAKPIGGPGEALAHLVPPDDSARAQVHPSVVVQIGPARGAVLEIKTEVGRPVHKHGLLPGSHLDSEERKGRER